MIEIERHAEPDEWEINLARFISRLGCDIVFLERSLFDHDRRCDSLVNGLRWEMKNPTGNGYLTIHNQLIHVLYGQDKHHLNPQSSRVLISNVRSTLTMEDMKSGLERALSGESGLTEAEIACLHTVALADPNAGKLRGYMKSRQVAPESPPGSLTARYDTTTFVHKLFGGRSENGSFLPERF